MATATQLSKLLALIEKNPGSTATTLRKKGWHPQIHGSLREAEHAGLIAYKDGGWYVTIPATLAGRQRHRDV